MRTTRNLLIALTAVAISLPAADNGLLNLIMPGAKVVSGVDMDRAKNSPFGQFLLSQMQKDDKGLNELITTTGFDPRRDLHGVIMASTDPTLKGAGLVVVRGSFDSPRILSAAKMHGAMVSKYKNADVIKPPKNTDKGLFALLPSGIAVAGDEASVKAAIDRSQGAAAPVDSDTVGRVNALSSKYDAWFFSTVPAANFTGSLPMPNVGGGNNNNMIEGILQTSGGMKLGSNVEISGEALTRSDKDATALMNVMQFLAGMIQMNRDKPGADKFANMLDSLKVNTQGSTMKFSLTLPEADVEKLFREGHNPGQVKRAPRKTASL